MKYGIYRPIDGMWYFPDCIYHIKLDPENYKSSVDRKFETSDLNVAYRYLEWLRKNDHHMDTSNLMVKERDQQ